MALQAEQDSSDALNSVSGFSIHAEVFQEHTCGDTHPSQELQGHDPHGAQMYFSMQGVHRPLSTSVCQQQLAEDSPPAYLQHLQLIPLLPILLFER
jgi:hypothetical protein